MHTHFALVKVPAVSCQDRGHDGHGHRDQAEETVQEVATDEMNGGCGQHGGPKPMRRAPSHPVGGNLGDM
jgi:hypothetical protein